MGGRLDNAGGGPCTRSLGKSHQDGGEDFSIGSWRAHPIESNIEAIECECRSLLIRPPRSMDKTVGADPRLGKKM